MQPRPGRPVQRVVGSAARPGRGAEIGNARAQAGRRRAVVAVAEHRSEPVLRASLGGLGLVDRSRSTSGLRRNGMMRVLVTGAGGFIGSYLVNYLKRAGYWVRGVDLKYPEFEPSQADEF